MMQRVLTAVCILFALGANVNCGNDEEKQLFANTGMQMLKVEKSNPYCNFQRLFGPMCNMTGFNGILSIEPDEMLTNALEVAIVGADTVLLYPTCVPWVKFYGAQDFLTVLHKSPGAGEKKETCRTWLRAFDSKITSLRSGIHDISLVNSSVHIISLHNLRDVKVTVSNISTIEHLDWKGYKGEIFFATIDNILHLECNDNLTTYETHIGRIEYQGFSFNARQLIINQTIIDEVYLQGILLNSGIIVIENTILRKVKRGGLVLGSDATLLMKNVTIEECQKPCITSSFRLGSRYFKATGVTVNGEDIKNDPDAIRVTLDEFVEDSLPLENDVHCSTSEDGLFCDFSGYDERVVLTPTENSALTRVNISNSENLHIVEACEMDVVVSNTMAVYAQSVRGNTLCEGTEGTLTSINSTFNVLHANDLKQITAAHSQINEIHADAVDKLVSRDSGLTIKQITVSNETNLFSTKVDIMNATFNGTLHANFTEFNKISDLHIAGQASIVNSVFTHMGIHGITVSGSLLLSHIVIQDYEFLPIYLTPTGTIELREIRMDDHWHFISAMTYDQVKWESKTSDELKRLVALRDGDDTAADTAVADEGQRNCTTILQLPRTFSGRYDIFCNYTGVEDVKKVSVSLLPSIRTKSLIIQGAESVQLNDVCSHEITLMDVRNATMQYLAYHCFYRLRIQNSHVMNIANEPTALKMDNSTIGEIESPFPMNDLGIYNSSIGTLIASPSTTQIQNSDIATLKMLMSHLHFAANHTSINIIESLQVFGHGKLINSNINRINYPGILIDGHLLIENVTIKYLDRESVTFVGDGSLTMVNVDIEVGWTSSFNLSKGSISMTNVTMLGAPLSNSIEVDHPQMSPKPVTEAVTSTVKVSPSQPGAPTTTAPAKPEARSTSEEKPGTLAPRSPSSSGSTSANQETQPWVKWATAGASIFLALVVVLVALSLVVVVRNYRTGETLSSRLSRMFRPANDDELQLSTELDIHLASDNTNTHYSRLPSI